MTDFEKWTSEFEDLSFEDSAKKIRDKILESPELDKDSRNVFTDAFEYTLDLVSKNKPLDVNLLRIHLIEIKGHKEEVFRIENFTRLIFMLALCGFQFDFQKINPEQKEK